jgi:hypothetical protein
MSYFKFDVLCFENDISCNLGRGFTLTDPSGIIGGIPGGRSSTTGRLALDARAGSRCAAMRSGWVRALLLLLVPLAVPWQIASVVESALRAAHLGLDCWMGGLVA